MFRPIQALNGLVSSTLGLDDTRSCRSVTPDILPLGGPAVNLPSPRTALTHSRRHLDDDSNRQVSVIPFPLMKENVPPADNPFSDETASFNSPSYDSFFSGLQGADSSPPISYEALWNTGSFRSTAHSAYPPIGAPTMMDSSKSISFADLPSLSSISSTPSHSHSLPSLSLSLLSVSEQSQSPLLSTAHLISLEDVPMNSLESSSLIKRKAVFEYVSAYPPASTAFEEPDPKRIKMVPDSELPISAKLDKVFDFFKTLGWTTGTFLHHLFAPKNRNIPRLSRHGGIVERFLNGRSDYTVAEILQAWWTTADGTGINSDEMYSVTTSYTSIRPVRAALSSFATQIIEAQLVREAQTAVHENSGLHASISGGDEDGTLQWANIGTTLIPTVKAAHQTHQPLAYHYMCKIAEPRPRKRNGVVVTQTYRPPDLVSTDHHAIVFDSHDIIGCHPSALCARF